MKDNEIGGMVGFCAIFWFIAFACPLQLWSYTIRGSAETCLVTRHALIYGDGCYVMAIVKNESGYQIEQKIYPPKTYPMKTTVECSTEYIDTGISIGTQFDCVRGASDENEKSYYFTDYVYARNLRIEIAVYTLYPILVCLMGASIVMMGKECVEKEKRERKKAE